MAHRTSQSGASGHQPHIFFTLFASSGLADRKFFRMRPPAHCVIFLATLALEDAPHGLQPTRSERVNIRLRLCQPLVSAGHPSHPCGRVRARARFRHRGALFRLSWGGLRSLRGRFRVDIAGQILNKLVFSFLSCATPNPELLPHSSVVHARNALSRHAISSLATLSRFISFILDPFHEIK